MKIARGLSYVLISTLMLTLTVAVMETAYLSWGNNSCGWDGGSFDCPMTHPIWDVLAWPLALACLLACRNVFRETIAYFRQGN